MGVVDVTKQFSPGLVAASGGFIVAAGAGACIHLFEGDAGLEELGRLGERFELLVGRRHVLVAVTLANPTLVIDFLDYGLMSRSIISIGALIVFMLLVISKLLDGIGRKINRVGLEIGEMASSHLSTVEEILELGIPIVLLITFSVYFKKIKVLP